MAMPGFTEVLTRAGAKREYCTQFFKAFDRNHDGFVDYDEFLLGMVAMVRRQCWCSTSAPSEKLTISVHRRASNASPG